MEHKIPYSLCREIRLFKEGVKVHVTSKRTRSSTEYLNSACNNFRFFIEIAAAEPLYSFLKNGERVVLLQKFHTHSTYRFDTTGHLELRVENNVPMLYFWRDREDERDGLFDNECISEEQISTWHIESIKRLGELTRKEIWSIIKKDIRHRRIT